MTSFVILSFKAISRPMAVKSSTSAADRSIVAGATSRCSVLLETMTAESGVSSLTRTSAIERSSPVMSMPRPTERFACGSRSTQRTRAQLDERAAEVDRGRGLAHAALLVGDRDYLAHRAPF